MSVTTGIVSRIDFNLYTHSAIDSHLAIQISAQINPGNSGGPVMQTGKVVGVAFQGYSGDIAQGVAYMIPTPVIRRFLKDIEDGHYDRYVDLGITYTKLQNPAQRHYLGLNDDDRGVLVGHRDRRRPVRENIAEAVTSCSRSTVIRSRATPSSNTKASGCRCLRWWSGNSRVTRSSSISCATKQPMSVDVTLGSVWPYFMQGHSYDIRPRYVRLRRLALSTHVARPPRGLSHQRPAGAPLFRFLRHRTNLSASIPRSSS